MSEIKLKIDGKEVIAPEGQTILEVARENGIEIPTMCHEDRISQTTSCFVCIVREGKNGNWMPSCSAIAQDGMEVDASSDAVRDMRRSALDLLLSEHTGDCEAPCTISCPAHARVEEYVRAGRDGDLRKTLEIAKERIPLPLSIGRVCPRFCEKDCRRNALDNEGVAINDFKRISADLYYDEYMEERKDLTGQKVAIIGSGPAGLAAAYFLRLEGVASDIYEKLPETGGMLRYGIPEYRLPKKTLDREIAHFEKMGGIKIFCNKELGKDIEIEELKKEYDAVIVAVGSWSATGMRTEGEELARGGIDWLEELARKNWQGEDPGETIVVGGGNTAMDCVRSALRLTDKPVHCMYRRTEKEMPAEQIEIDEAREEGAQFNFLTQPIKLRRENGKLVLECLRMELGEPDASGRRRPVPIEGSEFEVAADTVIAAIGQKTIAPDGLPTNKWGDVDVEEADCRAEGNVFAAGDCVSGPATVVEAVEGGRRTALGVLAYLKGEKCELPRQINVSRGHWQSLSEDDLVFLFDPEEMGRVPQRLIPLEERTSTFKEVSHTFTEEEIYEEGKRCIECSCTAKNDCRLKDYSEVYGAHPETFGGEKGEPTYNARHPHIILDNGKCVKCGICVKICSEVVNDYLLGFKNRGFKTKVETAFNTTLPENCTECGECVEACPVGALDWKKKKDE